MTVNKVKRFDFSLSLHGENVDYSKVQELLNVEVDRFSIRAPILSETDPRRELFYGQITWLLDLVEPKYEELKRTGVDFNDSEIWMTYFYFAQCNMEFDSVLLERMGRLGLKLCISCYQDEDLEVHEEFPNEVGTMGKGIAITASLASEITMNSSFDLIINVENNRDNKPFVLTDIEIEEFFLEGFSVDQIIPNPRAINKAEEVSDSNVFRYNSLIPPKESREFVLRLKAIKEGVFRGDITVKEGSQYLSVQIVTVVS